MDVFRIGFITITWVDIFDILLVTFLFYRIYVAMRGTIAAQVFLGLMLVIVGSFIAELVRNPRMQLSFGLLLIALGILWWAWAQIPHSVRSFIYRMLKRKRDGGDRKGGR